MSADKISELTFCWTIFSGLCVAAWALAPGFLKYVKPRWEEWRYKRMQPSRRAAKDLRRLAKCVGRIIFLLSYDERKMMKEINRELFKAENKIITESSAYLAMHSNKDRERISALLFLSQVEGRLIDYAKEITNAVICDKTASDKVRNVAEAALKELKEREKMMKEE